MNPRLTDLYYLEDENERLKKTIKRLEAELEEKTTYAAVFAARTLELLKLLGLTDEEIFTWYRIKK